jgi:hypothetical protein
MGTDNIEILSDAIREYFGNYELEIFNGRCWMVSCSLVEVGQVILCMIECVDTKPIVVKEIGRKWREAKVFL